MAITIIFLPLITVVFLAGLAVYTGRTGKYLSIFLLTITLYEVILNLKTNFNQQTLLVLGNWLNLEYLSVLWELTFNHFTLITAGLIVFLSTLIQLYSVSYMNTELNVTTFMALMSLFTFLMTLFVYANNTLLILVGWEGVGFLSYLLINFWNIRVEANKSSLKAVFTNKVGDTFLLLGIIGLFNILLSTNVIVLNTLAVYLEKEYFFFTSMTLISCITLFLLVACSTKSAQFIFTIWLPDAMEGPTPVSSLIHSATMVAAGFLLLIKFSGLVSQTTLITPCVFYIGTITCLLVSIEGICIFDHKSVLAGSTCEQLGLMFIIYGCGNFDLAFFHFCTHAFYKSLLFLSLGALIHQTGEQESRLMSILPTHTPLLVIIYQFGLLALLGCPGSISHYSKALILSTLYTQGTATTNLVYLCLQLTQGITGLNTVFGSVGLYILYDSLAGRKKQNYRKAITQSSFIKIPLLILSFSVLTCGPLLQNLYLYGWLMPQSTALELETSWFIFNLIPGWFAFVSLYFSVGILVSLYWYTQLSATLGGLTSIGVSTRALNYKPTLLTKYRLLTYSGINNYFDNLFNLVSVAYTQLAYDLGYIVLNGSLFNLSFYFRYLIFYNFTLTKLYNRLELSWLLSYQIIIIFLFGVQVYLN